MFDVTDLVFAKPKPFSLTTPEEVSSMMLLGLTARCTIPGGWELLLDG